MPIRTISQEYINMNIPTKFYKQGKHPTARTVGELKAILTELPDDLRIEAGFSSTVELVVYNHGTDDQHLEITEHDEDDD